MKHAPTIPPELLPAEYRELPALVRKLRAEIDALKNERVPERPKLTWASRKTYATHRAVSVRTVAVWLDEGLPHERDPMLRIHVESADAWLAARAKRRG